jgi:hypothetical protein
MTKKENPVYSVIINGRQIKCIDTSSGSTKNTKELNGDITLGPIVTGDRCVIVYKNGNALVGRILKLPSLSTITTFKA